MEITYIMTALQIIIGILALIIALNWRQNLNSLKLKLIPNSCILRFKTPSRKEEEIVVKLTDNVYRTKKDGKSLAYIIDATKMFFKTGKFHDSTIIKEKGLIWNDILKKQADNLSFSGKIPVLEFKTTDASPIDPYSKNTMVSAEMLEGMLVGAESTADLDFFKKLFGYKNIWQFAAAIAIGSLAAAFFGWQILNAINNNPILLGDIPVCKIAAETLEVIVPK